jgi:ribonuclease HII
MAKTSRDETLRRLEQEFPGYGFAEHKGYGTAAHRLAIQTLGYSAVHRLSFQIHTPANLG